MFSCEKTDVVRMEELAHQAGLALPIEQTSVWADFQSRTPGRSGWGAVLLRRDGRLAAVLSLIELHTHGYVYLFSEHGPVWLSTPDARQEQEAVEALRRFVRRVDPRIVFLRLSLRQQTGTHPVLSTIPYDTTVIMDLSGGRDQILARMSKHGRYDVRQALRKSPAVIAEETDKACADFTPYYATMEQTARRDGFTAAPDAYYDTLLRVLGRDHCRLYAAREQGHVTAWLIVTLSDNRAVYYFASSSTQAQRTNVPALLLFETAVDLGSQGCTQLDLMGVGSDFSPTLRGLNAFKTKFAKGTVAVAPSRDVPVRPGLYGLLTVVRRVRDALRRDPSAARKPSQAKTKTAKNSASER